MLFNECKLGEIVLKNRLVMAPMTRSRSINNIPTEMVAEYYGQRANAGLLITEGTSPSPNGLGYARIPGIFNKEQVAGWKMVTKAVHEKNSKIFVQLMHTGRVSHPDNLPSNAKVFSPSDIRPSGEMFTDKNGMQPYPTPIKMSSSDIANCVEEYIQASKNASGAGFDGVEIHGANGYLVEQFINPNVNNRDDKYGGSYENRARFLLEIIDGIAKEIGAGRIGLRLSPYGVFNDTGEFPDIFDAYKFIINEVSNRKIAYLHLVNHSSMGAPDVPDSMKELFRNSFKGTLILSGGYTRARAEKDIMDNKGDLVAFGRPFISTPNLTDVLKRNSEPAQPDFDTFYTPGAKGYIDYEEV